MAKTKLRVINETEGVQSPIDEEVLSSMIARALSKGGVVNAVLIYETADESLCWAHPAQSVTAAKGLLLEAYNWLFAEGGDD